MKIAIRMDDITPDMDWEKFNRFRALLDRYQVRPLLGIVPENRDPNLQRGEYREDFWEEMLRLRERGWVLAMHGCHHIYTTKRGGMFPLNRLSEFAGLPYEEQRRMIAEGKRILQEHGIETDLFMAPAHSYDRNTLRALRENGFLRVTDGFGTEPYRYGGITFYPISFQMERSLRGGEGATTLVVHANAMTEEDFARYGRIFQTQELLPYQEYLAMPAAQRGACGRLKEYGMATAKRLLVAAKSAARSR
ncbi:MAG: DUF2334 domain-containing protein [Eubacteriales bacterium]|nr:DUF2334 domain-containing protein [Eubacteriales bacterium]